MKYERDIDTDDLSKLQELLREYTGKLRDICEARSQSAFRQLQVTAFTVAITAVGMVSGVTLMATIKTQLSLFPAVVGSTAALLTVAAIVFAATGRSRTLRYSFDADQVASSLQKLITLSSQYAEHASRLVSEQLEFNLRLAEAEAALRFYNEVFKKAPISAAVEDRVDRIESSLRVQAEELNEAIRNLKVLFQKVGAASLPDVGQRIDGAELLVHARSALLNGDRTRAVALLSVATDEQRVATDAADLHNLGLLAESIQARELALNIWQYGHRRFPQDAALHRDYASVLARLERHDLAKQEFGRARELHPSDGMTVALMAEHLQRQGALQEAAALIQQSIPKVSDTRGLLLATLGGILGELGDHEEAKAAFGRAKQEDPDDDRVYSEEADYWEKRRDAHDSAQKAIDCLDRAIQMVDRTEARYIGFLLQKARIYKDLLHDDEAMADVLATALRASPADPYARQIAFRMLTARGMNQRAKEVMSGKWPDLSAEQSPAAYPGGRADAPSGSAEA